MPTLAMMAKEAYEKDLAKEGEDLVIENVTSRFMTLLDQKIHEARDMLVERFE